jgi:chemotaxis protein CheX
MSLQEYDHRTTRVEDQIDENQIDDAVTHVFEMLLRQRCVGVEDISTAGPGICATILISGALQGQCAVRLSTTAAACFTTMLLGADAIWEQDVIDDAVRELCNMIAGGWKSRLGALASACQISVPAISHAAPHPQPDGPTVIRRLYAFADSFLEVTLTLT